MKDAQVYIRIATPLDAEKLRAMFDRSSTETVYRRFHTPFPQVPGWMVALMLDADHHDKEALVAVAEGKVVGHAMYARLGEDGEAEMAIVVEDEWQSMGIGRSLLSELEERAGLRGIETFTGEVLGHNRPMLGLAATFSGTECATEDGVYHVRMPLRKMAPAAPALRRAA
jgi:GNAT superfamily N-acetyltransferase